MARVDPSAGGTKVQDSASGQWFPLPAGWTLDTSGDAPVYRPQDGKVAIEIHCDGFYIRMMREGRLVTLDNRESGFENRSASPMIGPFVDFWVAYKAIAV